MNVELVVKRRSTKMKLEITDAIDKGDRVVLKMEYDWEFAAAVAKIFDIKYASEDEIEEFVVMVLENMSPEDLELRYEINE
jgi:hypothetical protein